MNRLRGKYAAAKGKLGRILRASDSSCQKAFRQATV